MDDLIDRAAEACGGLTKLAEGMGMTLQRITNWRKRGVPIERCAELEAITNCAVRRWDMRPQDWHVIWPELIGTEGAPRVPEGAQPSPCVKPGPSKRKQRGTVLVAA